MSRPGERAQEVLDIFERQGVRAGTLVGLAVAPDLRAALALPGATLELTTAEVVAVLRLLDTELRPRWVEWSMQTASTLTRHGLRLSTCWDLAAVHRLLVGGWSADPASVWAQVQGLSLAEIPATAPVDLFTFAERDARDAEVAVRADGYLEPDWIDGGWASSTTRLSVWADLARRAALLQQEQLREGPTDAGWPTEVAARAGAAARAESTVELLCAELGVDGLPVDRAVAEQIISGFVGPRPASEAEAAELRRIRDLEVLRHVPGAEDVDLRSPGQVKSLLRRAGIEVKDTRAWRLEPLRGVHPVVDALLAWRKAERIGTTYGYGWLDESVGADGRLRGTWSGADGAAGRMTASNGLHNLPADLRDAVIAEPGHVFVRADLGQIEPRVLATVSGDPQLARATLEPDMYEPIASRLGVDRPTAKVAVLGAMYGQTTGHGATALAGLRANYPIAMTYLESADEAGQVGRALRTFGGRRIRMGSMNVAGVSDRDARARAAAQGRYARNAMVQGAAAELFKRWAVTVRAHGRELGARIVLCLHDELLVHVPESHGEQCAALVERSLQDAARGWSPDTSVRFTVDLRLVHRWSDAK